MGRRAVAATLVSFLVFTSLLANSALYSAENGGLGAAVLTSGDPGEGARVWAGPDGIVGV